jgi:hypothetical protein
MYKEDASKATYKSSFTASTTPHDQVSWRTMTTLPRESNTIQATPIMQVLLPQHHAAFDTDEANDADDMADVPVMLHQLIDRRGHGHADATHTSTSTPCMEK